jgi:hypothetical protein
LMHILELACVKMHRLLWNTDVKTRYRMSLSKSRILNFGCDDERLVTIEGSATGIRMTCISPYCIRMMVGGW